MHFLFFSLFFLCSCSNFYKSHPLDDHDLRIVMHAQPHQIDPRKAGDPNSGIVIRMLFDGLTRIDQNGKPQLSVADSVNISEDGLTYTFVLKDAVWTNGDKITSYDFKNTWLAICNPKFPAPNAYHFYPIKNAKLIKEGLLPESDFGVYTPDEKTLIVKLEQPVPYFLELTAFDVYFPVNSKMNFSTKIKDRLYITNGPFCVDSWKPHEEIVLKKNSAYWDTSNVHLESIHIMVIDDEHTALRLYEMGLIDWVGQPFQILPEDSLDYLRENHELICEDSGFVYWLILNCEKPPFNDINARKAISSAINRKRICQALAGNQIPAYRILPPFMNLYPIDKPLKDDVNLSSKLWKRVNKDAKNIKHIHYFFNAMPHHKKIAQLIKDDLQQNLDLNLSLQMMDWGIYQKNIQTTNFEIARYGWKAQFRDPINYLEILEENSAHNFSKWKNPKFNLLLKQSNLEQNPIKRNQLLKEAEQLVLDECPIIPIYFDTMCYCKNKKIQDVILGPPGQIDFKWAKKVTPKSP